MSKIKIGQIGIGHNHGEAKMLAVRKFPDLFDVIGYAEENIRWIERRGGLSGYAGLRRLPVDALLDQCDAVLVESDVWNLAKYAALCVNRGKHVHMDKPAGETPEVFKRILDTAKEKKLVFQLGYMYRYNPAVIKCLEYIKNGALGEIYSVNAEMSTYHSVAYKKWLTNFKGGIMYILGSHLIDLIVYILGRPDKVTSFLKHTGLDNIEVADNNLAVLEYEKALARIFVSSVEVNGWGRRSLTVSGSKGTVSIMPLENTCTMTYTDTKIAVQPYEDMKRSVDVGDIPKDCRYDAMIQDFYAYITGNKLPLFTYEHDSLVQEILSEVVGGIGFFSRNIG